MASLRALPSDLNPGALNTRHGTLNRKDPRHRAPLTIQLMRSTGGRMTLRERMRRQSEAKDDDWVPVRPAARHTRVEHLERDSLQRNEEPLLRGRYSANYE